MLFLCNFTEFQSIIHVLKLAGQQYGSTSLWQYGSTEVKQCSSMEYSSLEVQQYGSTAVCQYSSTAVQQYVVVPIFWPLTLEFSTLLAITEAGTIYSYRDLQGPLGVPPLLWVLRGVKWGLKLCPYGHCQYVRTLFWGSSFEIFDVFRGNRTGFTESVCVLLFLCFSTVLLLYCVTVLQQSCFYAILLYKCILLYCHTASLPYCCTDILLYCSVVLPFRCSVVMSYCCTAILLYCYTDTLLYCHTVDLPFRCSVVMSYCCSANFTHIINSVNLFYFIVWLIFLAFFRL